MKSPRSRGGFTTNITDYLDGYQYYDSNLQFFPTAEGYVDHIIVDNTSYYNYVYQYKDHLGNIRMNYAVDPADNVLKIKEENHYYPFGLKHQNYLDDKREFREFNASVRLMASFTEGGSEDPLPPFVKIPYNYKYQEQERQEELGLNWDSFKWRNYDYAIGRFMSIDPLTEEYVYNSPYAFQENKMGMGRELEGLELTTVGSHLQNETNKVVSTVKSSIGDFTNWISNALSDSNFQGKPERSTKDISVSLRSKNGGGDNPTTTGTADDHWNVDGIFTAAAASGSPLIGNNFKTFTDVVTATKDVIAGIGLGSAIVEESGIKLNTGESKKVKDTTITVTNNELYSMPHGNSGYYQLTNNKTKQVKVPNNQKSIDSAKTAASAREQKLSKEVKKSIQNLPR